MNSENTPNLGINKHYNERFDAKCKPPESQGSEKFSVTLVAARAFVFPFPSRLEASKYCKPNARPDCLRDGRVLAARALQVHHRAGGGEPSAAACRDGRAQLPRAGRVGSRPERSAVVASSSGG